MVPRKIRLQRGQMSVSSLDALIAAAAAAAKPLPAIVLARREDTPFFTVVKRRKPLMHPLFHVAQEALQGWRRLRRAAAADDSWLR